jgi:hypothetical protein
MKIHILLGGVGNDQTLPNLFGSPLSYGMIGFTLLFANDLLASPFLKLVAATANRPKLRLDVTGSRDKSER